VSKPEITDPAIVRNKLVMLAERAPLSVAAVDIDEFESINTLYGRDTGDAAIEQVADAFAKAADSAYFARTGGDEFLFASSGTTPEDLLLRLDGVRRGLDVRRNVGDAEIPLPVSIGIASYPHHTDEPEELVEAAGAAMQKAKLEGRNRVAIFVEDRMVLKSNYYPREQLFRLASLAHATGRTEASLLRDALKTLLERHRELT